METERNQSRRRERLEEAYARGLAEGLTTISAVSKLSKAYEVLKRTGSDTDVDKQALRQWWRETLWTVSNTSSQTIETTESNSAGNIIIEDELADDIASTMERLEEGIAVERKAMDGLIRRMTAPRSLVQG